jgi:8-oxo-dGTP diphosphatase
MARAGVVIVRDECVALIERRNSGRGAHYYVFPGGGIEEGETAEEAARREAEEELGVRVEVGQHVATVHDNGSTQHYFLADIVDGTFGTGSGAEMHGLKGVQAGTYTPCWFLIQPLADAPVYPQAVAMLIAAAATSGWPAETTVVVET